MPFDSRQTRLSALVFLSVILVLSAVWFFVLRTEYVPIYENIRESDASKIVEELDAAGIAYRLENEGHDVLVSKSEAADARVAVAGAEIPLGGTTGFELFNENDLGMTEFAQKINLQRAIQGELARTIMLIRGVEFARVHLALPERTLFRSEQQGATAAVSVEMQPNARLSQATIAGIRQLVAFSVPGLASEDVAVLDERGGVVSVAILPIAEIRGPAKSEREALERLLQIRAREAIEFRLPRQPFEVRVTVVEDKGLEAPLDRQSDETFEPSPSRSLLDKHTMRLELRTPQVMEAGERTVVREALQETLGFSTSVGDALSFSTGALTSRAPRSDPFDPVRMPSNPANQPALTPAVKLQTGFGTSFLASFWIVIPVALLAIGLLALRRRRDLSKEETESFAALLGSASLDMEAR